MPSAGLISKVDDVWTEVYNTVGLRSLIGMGDGTSWFDKKGIDTVVDGSAYTVRNIGRVRGQGPDRQSAGLPGYGLPFSAWAFSPLYGTSAKPDNLRRAQFWTSDIRYLQY